MDPRVPLVSINIPCYHQLAQARRCLDTVLAQSLGDFEITLLDDGASEAYRSLVESIGDARVRYHRNPVRLGAMRNMFQAITAGRGKYSLAFHEDDILGNHYLAAAVSILERDRSCGFVGGELREFEETASAEALRSHRDALSTSPGTTVSGNSCCGSVPDHVTPSAESSSSLAACAGAAERQTTHATRTDTSVARAP